MSIVGPVVQFIELNEFVLPIIILPQLIIFQKIKTPTFVPLASVLIKYTSLK